MDDKSNILLYQIAGITIEVNAGFLALESEQSPAALFISKDNRATPQFFATLKLATQDTQQHTPGNSTTSQTIEGNTDEFDWTIYSDSEKEIITLNYTTPSKYRRAELTLQGNKIDITYFPSEATPAKTDFYLFPLTNLLISRILHHQNGIMVHSSGVLDGDKGYIFTAVSGTGKSTMARLWQQKGATIINDDIITITTDNNIRINNIPMPHYIDYPKSAPLNAVFVISQSPHNFIRQIKGARAAMLFMANCIQQFSSGRYIRKHLDTVSHIAAGVPIYELGFKPDTDIVDLIREQIG